MDGILLGLNGAIMAYGQTSTGKTHTMVGDTMAELVLCKFYTSQLRLMWWEGSGEIYGQKKWRNDS